MKKHGGADRPVGPCSRTSPDITDGTVMVDMRLTYVSHDETLHLETNCMCKTIVLFQTRTFPLNCESGCDWLMMMNRHENVTE